MKKDRRNILILILILVIVLLLGLISYALLIRPALSGLVIEGQNQGYSYAIASLIQEAATCQPVPVTFGNQTINLIAMECLQQQSS